MAKRLAEAHGALETATDWMLGALKGNVNGALAGATPYAKLFAMASGSIWLAKGALAEARDNGKVPDRTLTARFYAEMLSVEAPGLARAIMEGSSWVETELSDRLTG